MAHTFPPRFDKAVISSEQEIYAYEQALSDKLNAEIISTVQENIFPEEFIYNANLHCNSDGAAYYTHQLAENIMNHDSQL